MVHRAADALLRRLLARAEGLGYFVRRFALEIAQQQRVSVRFAQFAQGGVQLRGNLIPWGAGCGGKQIIHDSGLLFAGVAAHF